LRALASGIAAAKSSTSGSATSVKGSQDSQNWMRWDAERSNRANQDYQREREEIAMRDLLRHLARRQQHYKARQQDRQSQNRPGSAYSFKSVASSPNLSALNGPPFGGSFLRLEQDWRETHMAYLQHRNATNAAQNTLTIGSKMPRPASATSLRSARHSRNNRH